MTMDISGKFRQEPIKKFSENEQKMIVQHKVKKTVK